MDPDQLRLVLLLLGILLVVGIYVRDRVKRRRKAERPPQARATRVQEKGEPGSGGEPRIDVAAAGDRAPDEPFIGEVQPPDEPDVAMMAIDDPLPAATPQAPMPGDDNANDAVAAHAVPEARSQAIQGWDEVALNRDPQFTLDLSFSAHGETDYLSIDPDLYDEVPRLIVQINLVAARGRRFAGPLIEKAAAEVDLLPGDMSIYHRRAGAAGGQVIFSLASIAEPGSFPFEDMAGFETPGLTLFTQLPGVRDGLAIYSDMLFTAQRLAVLLQGRLQDDSHSALTKQVIGHTRERILEHRRRIQLLRSRSKQ